ncbi:MAG: exodeoxyribonuclease III [Deltaproteobacteria bacterium]
MKIVTWNVNSLRLREDLVLNWIEGEDPDVVCLQETKVPDQEFPEDSFGDLEYDVAFYGQPAYNGVAIASHEEQEDVTPGFPSDDDDSERRFLAATVEGIRLVDLYVPNGQTYASDKYAYKLRWLDELTGLLEKELAANEAVVVCGDFNIAPRDVDAHDPHLLDEKSLFVSTEERAAFSRLLDLGLTDAFAHLHGDADKPYTWWDYRGGSWERNRGLRIDHFLVSDAVLARAKSVTIHRAMRGEEQPSDHVPVVLELD